MAGDFPNLSPSTSSQWPELNSIDPPSRAWYPPFAVTFATLSTITLFARLFAQIRKNPSGLDVDDLFASLAWVFAILYTIATMAGTLAHGLDKHIWDVAPSQYGSAALVQWLSEGSFLLSICFTKIAMLCSYRRLPSPCTKAVRRAIQGMIATIALFTLSCLSTQLLLCKPISAYWNADFSFQHPYRRKCADQQGYYVVQGIIDSLTTFFSILMPIVTMRDVPMSQMQRQGVRVISLIGIIVLGLAIGRTVFLFRLANSDNGDATWNGFNVFVWSQLEAQLMLTCASIAFLQRLSSKYPRVRRTLVYTQTGQRKDSVISRVSTSLSSQIKRLSCACSNSSARSNISRPRLEEMEIPEWEFYSLGTPRPTQSPMNEQEYARYVQGMYGPPVPPKDSRTLFEQYRRDHYGETV